jgi:hypothetical protein
MPYDIKKDAQGSWYLKNKKTGAIVNKRFKSLKTAVATGKNYMKYRGESAILRGRSLVPKP